MQTATLNRFRDDCALYIDNAIQFAEPVTVTTERGNAVLMSEELYRGIIATAELSRDTRFLAELKDAMNEPLEECVDASEVAW